MQGRGPCSGAFKGTSIPKYRSALLIPVKVARSFWPCKLVLSQKETLWAHEPEDCACLLLFSKFFPLLLLMSTPQDSSALHGARLHGILIVLINHQLDTIGGFLMPFLLLRGPKNCPKTLFQRAFNVPMCTCYRGVCTIFGCLELNFLLS